MVDTQDEAAWRAEFERTGEVLVRDALNTRPPREIICCNPVLARVRRLAIGCGVTIGIVTYSGWPGPWTGYDALRLWGTR